MAKVHPLTTSNIIDSSSPSAPCSSKRETLTVWMKSLVMQGNGCTAYNENGQIVYRIDNYDQKNSNEVYLMDLKGKVLFTILRKVSTCTSHQNQIEQLLDLIIKMNLCL